jgi:hypothetical protein
MPAIEVIGGYVTAPSTTETAWTVNTGDSLQIKNCDVNSPIYLLNMWGLWQTAGLLRIRSPRMHDNSVGIIAKGNVSFAQALIPHSKCQKLIPQDVLTALMTGSATGGDLELGSILVFYENLPGIEARLKTWDEIKDSIKNILCLQITMTMGTAGSWSGTLKINNDFDPMKANTDYALLGYQIDNELCSIGIRGPDTGNLRIGGPGDDMDKMTTREWFKLLSVDTGLPCVPIINSANRNATFVDGMNDENAATVIVQLIFGEL